MNVEPRRLSRVHRASAGLVVALAVLALLLGDARPAQADTSYGPIARAALAAVGKYEGECFPWVQRTVLAATGRRIGFDYRHGYLEAGGVEVAIGEARDGDVIQIANDADTSPTAGYAGLHTAIVIDNLGAGKFRVVDSNRNWDGIVRDRSDYSPLNDAARYPGLTVRIYRLPGTSGTAAMPTATPTASGTPTSSTPGAPPATLTVGTTAEVAADGDCLRARTAPTLSGSVLGCLPTGTIVLITAIGPQADGYQWVEVSGGAVRGWVAARYLKSSSTATTAAPVSAAPAQTEPPQPAPVAEGFASTPVFSEGGQAVAVLMSGAVEDLLRAATDAGASGVWAQDPSGAFHLAPMNGPGFVLEAFKQKFPGRLGPFAVTLVS